MSEPAATEGTPAVDCESPRGVGSLGRGGLMIQGLREGFPRPFGAIVWAGFIVFPLIDAVAGGGSALKHGLVIAGAAVFVAAYVMLVIRWDRSARDAVPKLLFVVMLVVATALTVADSSGWGFLFTYCAACAALTAGPPGGFYAVAICTVVAGLASAVGGASGGTVLGWVASSAGIGLLMLVMRDLRVRNAELSEARAELARLAVAQERERFARDLHDLLGHTLSVIALKAELAGRLLPDRPREAATEVGEVEQVARQALGEVRQAVSGYRQPTLDGELAGARMALSAAGIEASVQRTEAELDPAVEAVLAWAIREGATNVIRHSGAHHVDVTISVDPSVASVEVCDDGIGVNGTGAPGGAHVGNGSGPGPGHGLDGLAERADALHGEVEAGPSAEGGFRLAVRVPVAAT
jgi:two-component system sensor histidine kinase DesK